VKVTINSYEPKLHPFKDIRRTSFQNVTFCLEYLIIIMGKSRDSVILCVRHHLRKLFGIVGFSHRPAKLE
jgi:hypothetical protein